MERATPDITRFSLFARGISPMNVDAMHAALGLSFTIIWLVVGQIVVTNR